jgi:hypothetical protein
VPAGFAGIHGRLQSDQAAGFSRIQRPSSSERAMEEVLDEVLLRVRGEPDHVANDRRFATALYRMAVANGLMERISFEETQPSTR